MRNFNGVNERLKRGYIIFLQDTKGQDHTSLDKVATALVKFEESTKYKSFNKFHIEQARQFKKALARAKNPNTDKPLSLATIDATLCMVKGFFQWLAWQKGFKKVLTRDDAEYFNNSAKDARAAHTAPRGVPSPASRRPTKPFRPCQRPQRYNAATRPSLPSLCSQPRG